MDPVDKELLPEMAGARRVVYANNQPQYIPLPVNRFPDGVAVSEWVPTEAERKVLAAGGRIRVRLWQWTFNSPMQPVALELVNSDAACDCGFMFPGAQEQDDKFPGHSLTCAVRKKGN